MATDKKVEEYRKMLRCSEGLISLGGFIKEELEDQIYGFYEDDVLEAVLKHCEMGPGFAYIANEVEEADEEFGQYEEHFKVHGIKLFMSQEDEAEEGEEEVDWEWTFFANGGKEELPIEADESFKDVLDQIPVEKPICMADCYEWYLEQVARCAVKRRENGDSSFWQSWELSRATKKNMYTLNALEERVLYLTIGMETGKSLTSEEIAMLPEFRCNELLIRVVGEVIMEKMSYPSASKKEFINICVKHGYEIQK